MLCVSYHTPQSNSLTLGEMRGRKCLVGQAFRLAWAADNSLTCHQFTQQSSKDLLLWVMPCCVLSRSKYSSRESQTSPLQYSPPALPHINLLISEVKMGNFDCTYLDAIPAIWKLITTFSGFFSRKLSPEFKGLEYLLLILSLLHQTVLTVTLFFLAMFHSTVKPDIE